MNHLPAIHTLRNTQYETKYAKQTQFPKRRNGHKSFSIKDYEQITMNYELTKTNPIKPNLRDAQMNLTSFNTTNYEQKTMNNANKNKPKTNPILNASKMDHHRNFLFVHMLVC